MTNYSSLVWTPTLLPTPESLLGSGPGGPVAPTLALPSPPLLSYWQVDFCPSTPVLTRRRVPVARTLAALVLGAVALAIPAAVTGVAMIELGNGAASPAQDLPGFRPPPDLHAQPVACCQSAR